MATKKAPPATTKGPPKQFFGTFTLRTKTDDLERWKRAALASQATSVSELARTLLNKFAKTILGEE